MWKSGDQAIIQTRKSSFDSAGVNGRSCTLIKFLGKQRSLGYIIKDCWLVFVHDYREVWVSEHCLRKPYDGNELGSWEEIEEIFNPFETVT